MCLLRPCGLRSNSPPQKKLYVLPTQAICTFWMNLRPHRDYFPVQCLPLGENVEVLFYPMLPHFRKTYYCHYYHHHYYHYYYYHHSYSVLLLLFLLSLLLIILLLPLFSPFFSFSSSSSSSSSFSSSFGRFPSHSSSDLLV